MEAAAARYREDAPSFASPAPLGDCPLTSLLTRSAAQDPDGLALRDQSDRETWSGRSSCRMSYVEALDAVGRLAFFLQSLGLPPGARVGISLPGGSEACLALLAVESAGLTPCCVDILTGAGDLAAAIEAADMRVIITQSRVCGEPLAERLAKVAAGLFRVRLLLAFGPDVPDGAVDLDEVLASSGSHLRRPTPSLDPSDTAGFITFARSGGETVPVLRPLTSLVAAALPAVAAMDVGSGDRLVSCVAGDDLKGVATGWVAALVAGASFEPHGLFSAAALTESLRRGSPAHLVAPGWAEPALASPSITGRLRSVTYLHEAPLRFGPGLPSLAPIVDVLALGETALLVTPRGLDGRLSIRLDGREATGAIGRLLQVAVDPSGDIFVQGPSAASPRRNRCPGPAPDGWIPTGRAVTTSGGLISGIA